MNCSYRILKDVHIGVRVRKTKDKTTVPFKNDPMTDVKIVNWNDQGFQLRHPDLPKDIWVDFYQLPLDKIQMEYGVIKNPITFVEELRVGGSMVLVRADTLDYMEMLHDKKDKDEANKYGIRDLTPGDRVISCLCKQGNVMIYLGTFNIANWSYKYRYSYRYRNSSNDHFYYINETPERAFFAYEEPNGKLSVKGYPVQNKVVKEVYKCSDRGMDGTNPRFANREENMSMLLDLFLTSKYGSRYTDEEKVKQVLETYKGIEYAGYDRNIYIQSGKANIRENAAKFLKENQIDGKKFQHVFLTEAEAQIEYSKSR